MGTHPIFESDFDCLTECQTIKLKSRKNQKPNSYSVEAAEKRKKIGEKMKQKKEQKIKEKQLQKDQKALEREKRSNIMRKKTKKGQPALQARIGLFLEDLHKN